MKTVAYAYSGADAALIMSRIEAAGLVVFAHDFHTAVTYCEIGGAIGGVRICVLDKDAEEAFALLADSPLPTWKTPRLLPIIIMTVATLWFAVPFHARGTIMATPNGRYAAAQ